MCKYWIKNCIYARYTFFFFFLKRSKTCGPRLTDRERECRVTRCVNELENWKLLFIVVFNEYKRNTKEGANRSECLLRSIEPRSNFRSKYRLQACTSVTSYRSNIYESRERERTGKFQLTRSFHNHGGGFRSVRYSALLRTRLSSLVPRMFPFPCIIAIPYAYWLFRVTPGLEFIQGGEKIAASNLGD